MKTQTIRQRLLHSTMIGGAALMALVAVPAVTVMMPTDAVAQDYTSGTLSGSVEDVNGAPIAGATVTVRSTAQGIVRTATTNARGEFRVPLIPTGGYDVSVTASGYEAESDSIQVRLGGESSYVFTLGRPGETTNELDEIVVTGVRQALDFTQTTTGAVLDVEELVEQIPIARNVTAVTLLAPGAVAGDSAFGVTTAQLETPPSLSGASVAENAYYVNGLNTTNFINGLGGVGVPFEFYKTLEVKTGGYSAEFGRATGGVINAVTKSGSNDLVIELHGTWAPDSLREDAPNTLTTQNSLGSFDETTLTLEVGGPIIRDRLFAYGLVSWQDTESTAATTGGSYVEDSWSDDPFYGVKLDGYVTSDHRLEFTYWNNERTRTRLTYGFDPATDVIDPTLRSTSTLFQGGENYVGRYTGNFTDWLTLSAAYGKSTSNLASFNDLIDEPVVRDFRTNTTGPIVSRQTVTATNLPFETSREFWRADADVYFDLMGQHHLRFGYDKEETLLLQTSVRNGDRNYEYRIAGASNTLGLAAGTEYISTRVFIAGGGFGGENEALYLQDSWDVTDRLNLQLGVRQDKFTVADPNGTAFVNFDNEIAPRLGFTFDPLGDSRSRLYGSYGRYFLPVASNTAFRIASPAIDFNEFFRGAGPGGTIGTLDPVTGLPTAGLGPQITAATGAQGFQPCPGGVPSIAPAGTVACSVRDDGTSTPPEFISAQNLKSTYEDEWRIGYEFRLNDLWTLGVGGTYRKLGRVSEDALLDTGVIGYCQREGLPLTTAAGTGCADLYPGQSFYLIINPGFDVEALVTLPDDAAGTTVSDRVITLSAQDLGIPKARREYKALEFTFERAFDGVWGLQGSYVLSQSEGNYEGAVKSDLGQTDAGIVTDFDFLVFIPGQYGLLPNHRGHQFKLFGTWQATDDLLIGANFSLTSPRAYGCMGNAPAGYLDADVANNSYGAISRFCNNVVVDRGTAFETDWVDRLDLSFRYTVPTSLIPLENLTFRADIFNVLDRQNVTEANEFGELDGGGVDPDYMAPISYQPGRSVRLGFDLAF